MKAPGALGETMTARPWRGNERIPLAVLVAPLAVPLLLGIQSAYHTIVDDDAVQTDSLLIFLGIVALVAYADVIIFGVPAYLFLRACKLTAFWIAPVAGFLVGAIADSVFGVLVLPSLLPAPVVVALGPVAPANVLLRALTFSGALGAVVGAIFWLIARPVRRTQ